MNEPYDGHSFSWWREQLEKSEAKAAILHRLLRASGISAEDIDTMVNALDRPETALD